MINTGKILPNVFDVEIAYVYYKKILWQTVITYKSITVTPTTKTGLYKVQPVIGHFRVPPGLCFKTRVGAQPLIWKSFLILMQIKLIFTRKVVHLASFWKWGFLELGRGLLHKGGSQSTVVNTYCIFKNQTQISFIVLAVNNSITPLYKLRTYLA